MFYFKILAGTCIGIGMGWFSGYLNYLALKSLAGSNIRLHYMVILLIKLILYFIILGGVSLIGIELMLSIAISMSIATVAIALRNFTKSIA